jgi:hypothetical protein
MLLQLRPTQASHLYIKENAGGFIGRWGCKQLRCRLVKRYPVAASHQQLAYSRAKRRIVIDNVNHR